MVSSWTGENPTHPAGRARAPWFPARGMGTWCRSAAYRPAFRRRWSYRAAAGAGGCLVGVWAASGAAQALRLSASTARRSLRASDPPSPCTRPPSDRGLFACDCETPARLSAAAKPGFETSADRPGWRRDGRKGLLDVAATVAKAADCCVMLAKRRRIGGNRRERLRVAERRLGHASAHLACGGRRCDERMGVHRLQGLRRRDQLRRTSGTLVRAAELLPIAAINCGVSIGALPAMAAKRCARSCRSRRTPAGRCGAGHRRASAASRWNASALAIAAVSGASERLAGRHCASLANPVELWTLRQDCGERGRMAGESGEGRGMAGHARRATGAEAASD